jgi:hypothetical protein
MINLSIALSMPISERIYTNKNFRSTILGEREEMRIREVGEVMCAPGAAANLSAESPELGLLK